MKHELTYNDGDTWLNCRFSGNIDIHGVERFADEAIMFLGRHPGCKAILCDAREASMPLSVMQIWQIPRILTRLIKKSSRYHDGSFFNTRRAVVVKEMDDSWGFFETVTRNMGHSVRVFTDMEAAENWLNE